MRYTSSVSALLCSIQRYGLGLVTAVDSRRRHSCETSAFQKFGPGSCWLVTGHQDGGGPGEMVAEGLTGKHSVSTQTSDIFLQLAPNKEKEIQPVQDIIIISDFVWVIFKPWCKQLLRLGVFDIQKTIETWKLLNTIMFFLNMLKERKSLGHRFK